MELSLNIGTSSLSAVSYSRLAKNSKSVEAGKSGQSPAIVSMPQNTSVLVASGVSSPDRGEKPSNVQNPDTQGASVNSKQPAFRSMNRFVIERDDQSGLSVVKFMDSKGNIVVQVPPEQYLRLVQLVKEFGGLDILEVADRAKDLRLTGLLVDKKV